MSILEAIICGIVQGACEFLPVSSSGHLALLHGLFGIDLGGGDLMFDLLLHLGTLIAVAAVYGKDIAALIRSALSLLKKIFRGKFKFSALCGDERTVIMLVVSTFPLALAAFFKDKVEALSTYPKAVGVLLILNGLMLIFGGLIKAKDKKCEELGAVGALGDVLSAILFPVGNFPFRLDDNGRHGVGAEKGRGGALFVFDVNTGNHRREHFFRV